MNTVIVALLAKPRKKFEDVDYFVGFHHLVQSLKRHNKHVPPVVVISPDLSKVPAGAQELVRIDEKNYDGIDAVQMAFGKSVYFKLDVFRLTESGIDADRIVYFDTDVLTFANLEMLWDPNQFNEHSIYGIRECAEIGLVNPDWQGRLNAGVMLINRPMMGQDIFESMLELARSGKTYDHGDQGVINSWITENNLWDSVGVLPAEFNMPSCVRTHGERVGESWDETIDGSLSDWKRFAKTIKAMHYLGPRKPWRDRPEHEWYHADTQQMWDDEIANHDPLPVQGRPNLASSLHTRIVRMVQRYERWRKKSD